MGNVFDRFKEIVDIFEYYYKGSKRIKDDSDFKLKEIKDNESFKLCEFEGKKRDFILLSKSKSDEFKEYLYNTLNLMNENIDSIPDEYFKRKKAELFKKYEDEDFGYKGKNDEELKTELGFRFKELTKDVAKINNAFIPSNISSVVIPDLKFFRNHYYKKLSENRGRIIDLVEELKGRSKIDLNMELGVKHIEKYENILKDKAKSDEEAELKSYVTRVKAFHNDMYNLLEKKKSESLFESTGEIYLGRIKTDINITKQKLRFLTAP